MKEVTPEKVKQMLEEHGTIVSLEEAKIILSFMTDFATTTLEGIFDNDTNITTPR